MATVMRFIIAGDDRASASFNRFARTVQRLNRDLARNEAAMSRQERMLGRLQNAASSAAPVLARLGAGGGLLAAGSAATAMAAPVVAATAAVGAFGALALPTLSKVHDALSRTGASGKKAWAALTPPERAIARSVRSVQAEFGKVAAGFSPVVAKVVTSGARLARDLVPSLRPLAQAGAKIITAFTGPLDRLVKSQVFGQFVASLAKFGQQAGAIVGPQMVKLLAVLMRLFEQVMPAGVKILGDLLPALVTMAGDLVPVISGVVRMVAVVIDWLKANHLLIPALGAVGVALAVATDGILPLIGGIALAVAAVIHFWRTSSKFRDVVEGVFSAVGQSVLTFAECTLDEMHFVANVILTTFGTIIHLAARTATALHLPFAGALRRLDAGFARAKTATDNFFNNAHSKLEAWKRWLENMPKVAKLKGDITDLMSKLNTAEKALRNPDLTKTRRAQVRAEIADAIAGIAAVKNKLARLNGMTSVVYVDYMVGSKPYVVAHHRHGFATGTLNAIPGWHWVGERGPELVRFKGGEVVLNAHASAAAVTRAPVWSPQAQAGVAATVRQAVREAVRAGGSAPLIGTLNLNHVPGISTQRDVENAVAAAWRQVRLARA